MIGTTARILFGLIVGAAMLVAVTVAVSIAACTDLFAHETRPALRRVRPMRKRPALRSLMEANT